MFRDVPGCSGMFRHVPECSVFQVLSTAFSKYPIWNKPWSYLVDAASPRAISIIRKKYPLEPWVDCKQSTLNYGCWNLREMTYPDLESKEKRVEGGRAIAKSSGATDWQCSRTDGRNSSPVNSQLSSLKKELTWQIEDFSCDHVLIPSNIRSNSKLSSTNVEQLTMFRNKKGLRSGNIG